MHKAIFKWAAIAGLAFGVAGQAAWAQNVVGRSIVGGETVFLYDDGTWVYETAPEPGCLAAGRWVQFCAIGLNWADNGRVPSPLLAQVRYKDDRHYGQVIGEDLGSNQGLSPRLVREAVIQNAATLNNIPLTQVSVIDVAPATIGAFEGERVVYGFPISGTDVVFANTIVILPNRTFQFISYSFGTTFTDKHKELDAEFRSALQLTEGIDD